MRITSSVEYATRLMVHLARRHGAEPVTAEALSEAENVPADYVNQLLLRLRRRGLVASQRGAAGGYVLGREPGRVTLGEVIRAVEGSVFEEVCDRFSAGSRDCRHQGRCGISPVWQRLSGLIQSYLDSVSLDQLLGEPAASRPDRPGA